MIRLDRFELTSFLIEKLMKLLGKFISTVGKSIRNLVKLCSLVAKI